MREEAEGVVEGIRGGGDHEGFANLDRQFIPSVVEQALQQRHPGDALTGELVDEGRRGEASSVQAAGGPVVGSDGSGAPPSARVVGAGPVDGEPTTTVWSGSPSFPVTTRAEATTATEVALAPIPVEGTLDVDAVIADLGRVAAEFHAN